MADVQKWIDELRAGKVVGRIVLKNRGRSSRRAAALLREVAAVDDQNMSGNH
jgi:hypothetical protein